MKTDMMQTGRMGPEHDDNDFYEEDEPIEAIRAVMAREPDGVTGHPPSVLDVAAYLLPRLDGTVDGLRLEKLCYLIQAHHLAATGIPAFLEHTEAWIHGPVIPHLYRAHRRQKAIGSVPGGDPTSVETDAILVRVIDSVLDEYGDWSGHQLRLLTHAQPPWLNAREGLAPDEPSRRRIPPGAMREYFRQLQAIPGDDYEDDELGE